MRCGSAPKSWGWAWSFLIQASLERIFKQRSVIADQSLNKNFGGWPCHFLGLLPLLPVVIGIGFRKTTIVTLLSTNEEGGGGQRKLRTKPAPKRQVEVDKGETSAPFTHDETLVLLFREHERLHRMISLKSESILSSHHLPSVSGGIEQIISCIGIAAFVHLRLCCSVKNLQSKRRYLRQRYRLPTWTQLKRFWYGFQ